MVGQGWRNRNISSYAHFMGPEKERFLDETRLRNIKDTGVGVIRRAS